MTASAVLTSASGAACLLCAVLAGAVLAAPHPSRARIRALGLPTDPGRAVGGPGGPAESAPHAGAPPRGPAAPQVGARRRRRPPARRASVPAVAAAGALAVAFALGPPLAAAGLVAAEVLRRGRRVRRRAEAAAAERAVAVRACEVLATELRTGRSPAAALTAAAAVAPGPLASRLSRAAAAAVLGGDPAHALAEEVTTGGPGRSPRTDTDGALPRQLAACWAVGARTGAGLADALDRLAAGLRAAEQQRQALEAELAGPRATARLLALLPGLGLLLGAAAGADPLAVLGGTWWGAACLLTAVSLDLVGLAWTDHLVRRAAAVAS